MQVLSGAVEPIPEHYSFELNQLARKLLTADPAQRPSIDEVLALPEVGDESLPVRFESRCLDFL